jgi:hypothetical protein
MRFLTLALLFVLAQDPPDPRLAPLIERLKADEIEVRERAAREIVELGEPVADAVEKEAAATGDAELAGRLKTVALQIRRNVLVAKVAPPAKRVTVSARELPLRDVLKTVCEQAGIEYACDPAVADKSVTFEAKDESLLQAVDRACAAAGETAATVTDGKLRIAPSKGPPDPAAYAEGYRLRIRKVVLTDTVEAGASRTSAALYFELEAPPDHQVRNATLTLPRSAVGPEGEDVPVKPVGDIPGRMAAWGGGASAMVVDGVAVSLEAADSADRIALLKEIPAGAKTLKSLKVTARFRYAIGLRPVTAPLSMKGGEKLSDIPFNVTYTGQQVYFMPQDNAKSPSLEDFVDVDSMVLVGKDGKENKLSANPGGGMRRAFQYIFHCEKPLVATDAPQLKIQLIDAFERDVEFELKDVRLREESGISRR